MDADLGQARAATLALIAERAEDATVCPSEVARALAAARGEPQQWRNAMPLVHTAVDLMVAEGLILLSWKGRILDARIGPYRLRPVHAVRSA